MSNQNLRKVAFILVSLNVFRVLGKLNTRMFYLLLWTDSRTHPFDRIELGMDTFLNRNCKFNNCYITDDSAYLSKITDYDVILFNAMELIKNIKLGFPKQRLKHQRYVFASTESPVIYPLPDIYDGKFNWTWTYRLDSTVKLPYIVVKDKRGKIVGPAKNLNWLKINKMKPISKNVKHKLKRKKKAAAWFVSNCHASDQRINLGRALQKELALNGQILDIYGRCGDLNCSRGLEECHALIEDDYYFYLAFENSFSEDYVTEKLLTALKHFAVPVVYGGANYSRFMPPGIYLDARMLSVKDLANRMTEAILSIDIYYEYFKWHRYYSYHDPTESPNTDGFCLFCAALNNNKLKEKHNIIDNFHDWWNKQTEFPETSHD